MIFNLILLFKDNSNLNYSNQQPLTEKKRLWLCRLLKLIEEHHYSILFYAAVKVTTDHGKTSEFYLLLKYSFYM